jgi:predicted nucleic acid-binding protein
VWNFAEAGIYRANSEAEMPPRFLPVARTLGVESILAAPLWDTGRHMLGVLFVANKPGGFSEADVRLLEVFSGQVTVVLQNIHLLSTERTLAEKLGVLYAIADATTQAANEDQLIEHVTLIIGQRLYSDSFGILLLDEIATAVPGQLNTGLGWTVPRIAEAIKERCKEWGIKPRGVADDAIFARTGSAVTATIAEEFRKAGVHFRPAKKADRVSGWEALRRMMQDAGATDRPGFYAARHCEYFWATVPYLARDPRKANDLDSRGPDHAADALAAALCHVHSLALTEKIDRAQAREHSCQEPDPEVDPRKALLAQMRTRRRRRS